MLPGLLASRCFCALAVSLIESVSFAPEKLPCFPRQSNASAVPVTHLPFDQRCAKEQMVRTMFRKVRGGREWEVYEVAAMIASSLEL